MILKIKNYLSLVKFSHTVFAMPFAIIGFVLALTQTDNTFNIIDLASIVICVLTARNAAMGFNRYLDRDIDAKNPRTVSREIPAGIISPKQALIFIIINSVIFIITTYFINDICFYLSPIALAIVLTYSYTKRFSSICHFVLSLGLSLAPIGAWLVVVGEFQLLPILFSVIVLFWVSGFDIIYSCQDRDFDHSEDLHSIPVRLGVKNALRVSWALHIVVIGIIVFIGFYIDNIHYLYWVGASLFSALNIYQHLIVKHDDLSRVNLAFGTMNGIASVIFAFFTNTALLFYV